MSRSINRRLKSDNKEVKANFCSRKGGQIGLFSQPYINSLQSPCTFEDVPLCEVCSFTLLGHGLLPPFLDWPGWSCFPGQDHRLACSCGRYPTPLQTTHHSPSIPLAIHFVRPSNALCIYDMWQGSIGSVFPFNTWQPPDPYCFLWP